MKPTYNELVEALKEHNAMLEWAYTQVVELGGPARQDLVHQQTEYTLGRKIDGYLPMSQRAKSLLERVKTSQ